MVPTAVPRTLYLGYGLSRLLGHHGLIPGGYVEGHFDERPVRSRAQDSATCVAYFAPGDKPVRPGFDPPFVTTSAMESSTS